MTETDAARRPIPPFTEEHEVLRAEIRSFVARELRPHAAEREAAPWFPDDVLTRMAEGGLLGLKYPVEYGGRGDGYLEDAVLPRPGAVPGRLGGTRSRDRCPRQHRHAADLEVRHR
jgi:alkylation response protein AidB-like acyl-CoA dehydrogenase